MLPLGLLRSRSAALEWISWIQVSPRVVKPYFSVSLLRVKVLVWHFCCPSPCDGVWWTLRYASQWCLFSDHFSAFLPSTLCSYVALEFCLDILRTFLFSLHPDCWTIKAAGLNESWERWGRRLGGEVVWRLCLCLIVLEASTLSDRLYDNFFLNYR